MADSDVPSTVLAERRVAAVVVVVAPGATRPHPDGDVVHALQDLAFAGVPVVTTPADRVRVELDGLGARGIGEGLVLVVGCTRDGGRATVLPAAPVAPVLDVLRRQGAIRRRGGVPDVDPDPRWIVELPSDVQRRRVAEALGALANGVVGTRASLEEDGPEVQPTLVAAGLYTGEDVPRLVEGPDWARRPLSGAGPGRRTLDLRTGVLHRLDAATGLRSVRFASMARPTALVSRVEAPPSLLPAATDPGPATQVAVGVRGGLAVAGTDRTRDGDGVVVADRIAAVLADRTACPRPDRVRAEADRLADLGVDRLLAEHRAAWADRWRDAEVTIEGSPEDELAARFAVFHLLSCAAGGDEVAVGPRGLTGPAYGGHVFWDADVFVLPALAALRPEAAAAMLAYRDHRLPAAEAAARRAGLAGARLPWESADDGSDVTPLFLGPAGHLVPILTDDHEEHIVADVAWAADRLVRWGVGGARTRAAARRILVATGRYWASRLEAEDDPAHIRGVMGPDEYHDAVDDDAFTNVMASWNLRRAAAELDDPTAASRWSALADGLVDGWDPVRGAHEQFAGFWACEPLVAEEVSEPPFAADLLLGAERVAGSQLVKQPDVLMLHLMVPDAVRPGSLAADLAVYGPRTVHGSSLSPAVHSALHARASQPDRALALYRMAARLDLDDLTGTTAGGVHLATMGGLWQALAHGFLGLADRPDGFALAPCLPDQWDALGLRFRFRGQRIGVRADHEAVHVDCERPTTVVVGRRTVRCDAGTTTVPLRVREESPCPSC